MLIPSKNTPARTDQEGDCISAARLREQDLTCLCNLKDRSLQRSCEGFFSGFFRGFKVGNCCAVFGSIAVYGEIITMRRRQPAELSSSKAHHTIL